MSPNILFLHSHNSGRFIQPYGHGVPTPNLMRLARQGVLFRKAFAAAPSCSPSRASFLTGRHPHCCGMLGLANRGFALSEPEHHIARFLKQHDYETALCGIEHVAPHESGVADAVGYDRVLTRGSSDGRDIAPAVCDYLRNVGEQPFFLSVGTQEAHTPYPDPDPVNFPAENADYSVPPRPFSDTVALREMTAGYKRSAREMDDCFGVILETLAETGLDRKTYVFAFSDHGLQWPLHIANVGEHGNAAFLIARGPAHFTGGGALDAMISLMDLFPTVCDVAGLEQPSWLQGQSLLPLTSGEVSALHDKLFFEQTYHAAYEPMRAVRTERHIYIKRFDDRDQLVLPNTDQTPAKDDLLAAGWKDQPRHQEMLYDLYFDPDQQNNLIGGPGTDEIVSKFRRALTEWMEETDDPLCEGPVPLPKFVKTTNPDAFAPSEQPWIVGE